MASSSVERVVMAYDGSGNRVPTPESQTVSVPLCPVPLSFDCGTPWTPQLARFLYREGIDQLPHKLLRIDPPGTLRPYGTKGLVPINHWHVEFAFEKPSSRSPFGSKISSVCVFNERDARDPYFNGLCEQDRKAIIDAVCGMVAS